MDEMDKPKKQRPDHPQSWGEAQDDEPDSVPAPKDDEERPHNREVEYEDLQVPKKEGVTPRPATDPAPGKNSSRFVPRKAALYSDPAYGSSRSTRPPIDRQVLPPNAIDLSHAPLAGGLW